MEMEPRHRDALRRIYQAEQVWAGQGGEQRSFMLLHLGGMRSDIDHPAWDPSWAVPSEFTIDDLAELKLLRVELSENKARTFVLTMKGRAQAAKLVASSTIAMSGSTPSHNPPEPGVTTPAAGATVTPFDKSPTEGGVGPTAFISWAHGDAGWEKTIADFAVRLRTRGIVADIDLFELHNPTANWATYGARAIDDNEFVIIAVNSAYKERWDGANDTATGAGAAREANVLKALFNDDQAAFYRKVKVVVLPGATKNDIPAELKAAPQHFAIDSITDAGIENLLRTLTGQPAFPRPAVGNVPVLPPKFMSTEPSETTDASRSGSEKMLVELQGRLLELERRLDDLAATEHGTRANLNAERITVEAALGALTSAGKSSATLVLTAGSAGKTEPAVNREKAARSSAAMTTEDATMIALAQVLIDKGDFAAAEQRLRQVVDRGNGHGMVLLGMILHDAGRDEEAVAMLRRAVAAGRREALTPLGLALHALGRLNEAESVLAEAAAQEPSGDAPGIGIGDSPRPAIFGSTRDLLRHLQKEGAQTNRQLEGFLGDVDQIGAAEIAEWAEWAEQAGTIEPTKGSTVVRRWNITDKGQAFIGPPDSV
jgi:tetratricopeptide (TPR) repeat protein